MTVIYMVRHGRTNDSGKRITGYRSGIHLNDLGLLQASQAAEFLKHFQIRAVYASPLERTMETAQTIAAEHLLPVHPVDFLKEINFGDYQGKGEELSKDLLWQLFQREPSSAIFPNGESVQQAQIRIVSGLSNLIQTHKANDEIVCVSHCEVLRLALAHALHIPLDYYSRLSIDTGSVSKVIWNTKQQVVCYTNRLT